MNNSEVLTLPCSPSLTHCSIFSSISSVVAVLCAVSLIACFAQAAHAQTYVELSYPPDAQAATWNSGTALGVQCLYLSTEVGTSGTISQLFWLPYAADGSAPLPGTYTIVLTFGDTDLGTLTPGASFAANMNQGSAQVFSGSYAIPTGAAYNEWTQIALSGTFNHNNAYNLCFVYQMATPGTVNNYWGGLLGDGVGVYTTNAPYDTGENDYGGSLSLRIAVGGGNGNGNGGGGQYSGGPYGAGGEIGNSGKGGGGCFIISSTNAPGRFINTFFPPQRRLGVDVSHLRLAKVVEITNHPHREVKGSTTSETKPRGLPIVPILLVGALIVPAGIAIRKGLAR